MPDKENDKCQKSNIMRVSVWDWEMKFGIKKPKFYGELL